LCFSRGSAWKRPIETYNIIFEQRGFYRPNERSGRSRGCHVAVSADAGFFRIQLLASGEEEKASMDVRYRAHNSMFSERVRSVTRCFVGLAC
jgi:hypothetical protein